MARQIDVRKREELLSQACEILSRSGVVDTSLRSLAAQMDTSARMLIYYFGSKEQLILEVLAFQQRRFAPDPEPSSISDLRAYVLADWESITRGEKRVGVRILEQVFGAACAQDSPYAGFTTQTLTQLISVFEARLLTVGMPAHVAATRAVVCVTALQGFIMCYYTSEDPTAVDRDFLRLVDDVLLAPF